MNDSRENVNTVESITIGDAFEELGDFFVEAYGDGDGDAGWARLQRALDADEDRPTDESIERIAAMAEAISRIVRTLSIRANALGWGVILADALLFALNPYVAAVALGLEAGGWAVLSARQRLRAQAGARAADCEQKSAPPLDRKTSLGQILPVLRVNGLLNDAAADPEQPHTDAAHAKRCGVPGGVVDLSGADLRDVDLAGVNLIGAQLTCCTLEGMPLRGANFFGTNLMRAQLFSTDLSRAELTDADLTAADLTNAALIGARLSGAHLPYTRMIGANLTGANLSGADLSRADLSGAVLSGADLSWAHLPKANLSGAILSKAVLYGAELSGARLPDANLRGAHLSRAHLAHADLSGANLCGANLNYSILVDADLTGARLPDLTEIIEVTWSVKTQWGAYQHDVFQRSIPLGAGRYQLNPSSGTHDDRAMPTAMV
ncbi:pentapeptide repeat-containing protein [Nocardia amamiensis]|uniref:pentapeptide repeat-containing protein n=1 Tax=Nocardia amamiensis TaxID=404578 RepID=UPI00082CE009|nr:pentapeptide repeat-containing protein [Nocardia amamiensis]